LATGARCDTGILTFKGAFVADATSISGATPRTDTLARTSSSQPQMGAAATLPDDDDDKFEVIMGRPCFQGPEPISLPEALDTAYASLSQVRHVLQSEWDDLGAKKQCLKEWSSLLKTRTESVQPKAAEKRAHLDAMEKVLREEQVAIR
jgi:hypothetical protein